MSLFIEYYLILILIPVLFIETIPQSFYNIKSRYPLFLSLQISLMSVLMHLSFRTEFPLISVIPVYDLFEIRFILDMGSSLFLISFSISVFIVLLRLAAEERKKMTFLIMAIFLIALSGNTITFFLSSFLYLIICQLDIKDKFYSHLIDSIPLFFLFCAFLLVLLTGKIQSSQDILYDMGFLSKSGVIIFFIMSGFFLPVLLTIHDVLFHSSPVFADAKLFITSSSLLYILSRFTVSLNESQEILNYSFPFFILLILLSIIILIFCQRKKQSSLIPLMFFYFMMIGISFMGTKLYGQLPIHQNYLYGFSLYLILLITIDDILPLVRGNVGRFSLIMALSVFLLFNPWMNAGKTFYYVLSFVINGGPVLIIFFVVTVLLVILTTMFSVLSTKYKEESGNIQFSEKYVFLIGIMVFLILFERFF